MGFFVGFGCCFFGCIVVSSFLFVSVRVCVCDILWEGLLALCTPMLNLTQTNPKCLVI